MLSVARLCFRDRLETVCIQTDIRALPARPVATAATGVPLGRGARETVVLAAMEVPQEETVATEVRAHRGAPAGMAEMAELPQGMAVTAVPAATGRAAMAAPEATEEMEARTVVMEARVATGERETLDIMGAPVETAAAERAMATGAEGDTGARGAQVEEMVARVGRGATARAAAPEAVGVSAATADRVEATAVMAVAAEMAAVRVPPEVEARVGTAAAGAPALAAMVAPVGLGAAGARTIQEEPAARAATAGQVGPARAAGMAVMAALVAPAEQVVLEPVAPAGPGGTAGLPQEMAGTAGEAVRVEQTPTEAREARVERATAPVMAAMVGPVALVGQVPAAMTARREVPEATGDVGTPVGQVAMAERAAQVERAPARRGMAAMAGMGEMAGPATTAVATSARTRELEEVGARGERADLAAPQGATVTTEGTDGVGRAVVLMAIRTSRNLREASRVLSPGLPAFLIVTGIATAACGPASSQAAAADPSAESRIATVSSGCCTLYATDILLDNYCFGTASYGAKLQDGQPRNVGAQLEFGRSDLDQLSVFGSGGEHGVIVEIAAPDSTQRALYHSIRRDGDVVYVPGANGDDNAIRQVLIPPFEQTARSTGIHPGGIYAIRIDRLQTVIGDSNLGGTAYIKLLVLALSSGQYVTLKWDTF
jgi:hypothetical protein